MSTVVLNSGRSMPLFGLGTYKIVEDQVLPVLDAALGIGYRLIDTAHYYHNEQQIGDSLKILLPKHNLKREDVFIITKLFVHPDVNNTVQGIEQSLSRLQTDYIDLMLIHAPQPPESVKSELTNQQIRLTTWQIMQQFAETGQLRSIGVSNFECQHLQHLLDNCKVKPAINQIELHPYFARNKLRQFCNQHDIHVQAFASLGRFNESLHGEPSIHAIAEEHKCTVGQVLLAWALNQDISVLPKSTNPERLRVNFESVRIKLSDENMKSLNSLNRRQPLTRCAPCINGLVVFDHVQNGVFVTLIAIMTSNLERVAGGAFQLSDDTWLPKMGFGTFRCTEDSVKPSLEAALKAGYRLIDTAQLYENEAEIGLALKELLPALNLTRQDIFITTKVQPGEKQEILTEIDTQLSKLQTDYLDLVLIHYPRKFRTGTDDDEENATRRQATWEALEEKKDSGAILSIGVSNYEIRHLHQLFSYARHMPTVNQCEFHPHFTRDNLRKYCENKRIHFQAFTSLGRNDPELVGEPVIVEIAGKHQKTVQQVLLAWALHLDVSVVPKSQNPDRINANFESINVKLDDEDMEKLNALNKDKSYTKCEGWNVM